MTAVLFIAAMAQCGPGGCPSPSRSVSRGGPSQVYAPQMYMPRVRVQPQPAIIGAQDRPYVEPKYDWHRISHEGLSFPVWGTLTDEGKVRWNPDLPDNVRQYEAAKEARRAREPGSAGVPKEGPAQAKAEAHNFGVDPDKRKGGARYTATSAEAARFVREAQAPTAKSERCYFTVIGNPSDRKAVAEDWRNNPAFGEFRDKVWFQEFDKGDWQVKDELGYRAGGKPTILIQQPGGEVLLRLDRYTGPQPIANALRKADPDYRPDKDPGPGGDPSLSPDDNARTCVAVGAALLAALILIPARRKTK